ncbi:MAG: hypothetical protein IPL16_02240 [Ignavibacteria bacterium]|nr:hypothetical protein [Ignavibacteria bacterium]
MERQWEIQAIRSINGTAMGNSSYPFHKWNGNENPSFFHKWNGNGNYLIRSINGTAMGIP